MPESPWRGHSVHITPNEGQWKPIAGKQYELDELRHQSRGPSARVANYTAGVTQSAEIEPPSAGMTDRQRAADRAVNLMPLLVLRGAMGEREANTGTIS